MTIIDDLTATLEQRKTESADHSYVASLYAAGTDKILEKIGEEATEVIIAGKNAASDPAMRQELVKEVADLWFHTMVLLADQNLCTDDILAELANRFGISGHDEKAARPD